MLIFEGNCESLPPPYLSLSFDDTVNKDSDIVRNNNQHIGLFCFVLFFCLVMESTQRYDGKVNSQ